MNELLRNV